MYISFLGPFDKDKPWDTKGIEGVRRFLDRVWRLCFDEGGAVGAKDAPLPEDLTRLLHKTIKKVGEDYETMSFNTAISAMMILVNEVYKANLRPKSLLLTLAQLLMPIAPHFSEEIWNSLGGQGLVSIAPWPKFDPALTVDDTVEMGVQVNGKSRGSIQIAVTASENEAVNLARAVSTVANAIGTMAITKVIYKPGKILNLIVK
jgi:leucyl-tRNA synthetase